MIHNCMLKYISLIILNFIANNIISWWRVASLPINKMPYKMTSVATHCTNTYILLIIIHNVFQCTPSFVDHTIHYNINKYKYCKYRPNFYYNLNMDYLLTFSSIWDMIETFFLQVHSYIKCYTYALVMLFTMVDCPHSMKVLSLLCMSLVSCLRPTISFSSPIHPHPTTLSNIASASLNTSSIKSNSRNTNVHMFVC